MNVVGSEGPGRVGSSLNRVLSFEPIDVVRHGGSRNALAGRELADADTWGVLDRDEQRHLLRRDADLPCLATQLAPDS